MNVLLVGSGGREHALAWKLAQSPLLGDLHAAPGNPGIAEVAHCHPVRPDDAPRLLELAGALGVDLVVIGPEAPLVAGLGDELRRRGRLVFGPSRDAAMIEGSKRFAKEVMLSAGVAFPTVLPRPQAPCVLKADGLAAGKGVVVCRTRDELEAGLLELSALPGEPVVEELLEGPEVSILAICDGARAVPLPAVRDYKRAYDGDLGPNTGGMGSVAPAPLVSAHEVAELVESIHVPVLGELARRGAPFSGTLFAGLMLTADGPRVLEFNCRFGDPETQSLVPLLAGDLLQTCAAAAAGELQGVSLPTRPGAAVTVVLVASGYPACGDAGSELSGIEAAKAAGALAFHAGTAERAGRLVTAGGRILGVTATGATATAAREAAYAAADLIRCDAIRRREDIGLPEPGRAGPASRLGS